MCGIGLDQLVVRGQPTCEADHTWMKEVVEFVDLSDEQDENIA